MGDKNLKLLVNTSFNINITYVAVLSILVVHDKYNNLLKFSLIGRPDSILFETFVREWVARVLGMNGIIDFGCPPICVFCFVWKLQCFQTFELKS